MLSSIASGRSVIHNFLPAEDPLSTMNAFRAMGIKIEETDGSDGHGRTLVIEGKGLYGLEPPSGQLDCGNSGTTMRLMSGILAAQPFSSVLTGDESLARRPMMRIIKPLTEMGAKVGYSGDGLPPLEITGGKLRPITYRSPVASAQVKSCILLAGLYCDGTTRIIEPARSRDHTERMLASMGADLKAEGPEVSISGAERLDPLDMSIPGDISSAAFFLVAGLIVPGSEIQIIRTGINPTRTGIVEILKIMGADITITNETAVSGEPVADLTVRHSSLRGIDIPPELVPSAIDEFPAICVAAALAEGKTTITGAAELRVKESDRIAVMASALSALGVTVEELDDGLIIEGREEFLPAEIDSHHDHRVAMSMAVAGLACAGGIEIAGSECIDISFPGFVDELTRLSSK
jgi:3-phosphoshikimate 1-carboxyvinyltransferase